MGSERLAISSVTVATGHPRSYPDPASCRASAAAMRRMASPGEVDVALTSSMNARTPRPPTASADAVVAAEGVEAVRRNTWVQIVEVGDGGWGIAGHAVTLEQMQAALRP
jgi:hypothetical protein